MLLLLFVAIITEQERFVSACKYGAARELYEETKIDFRNRLDRLQPAMLGMNNDNNDKMTSHIILSAFSSCTYVTNVCTFDVII